MLYEREHYAEKDFFLVALEPGDVVAYGLGEVFLVLEVCWVVEVVRECWVV